MPPNPTGHESRKSLEIHNDRVYELYAQPETQFTDPTGYSVIELNGAVDFDDPEYSPPGDNFYDRIAEALELDRLAAAAEPAAAEAGIV